jgi:4-oxalocrotonate tautomerase
LKGDFDEMPVIIVELWEGRSPDQKRRLVKAFTEAMVEIANASPEHLHIIFHDVPKESWGRNGVLAPDLAKEKK